MKKTLIALCAICSVAVVAVIIYFCIPKTVNAVDANLNCADSIVVNVGERAEIVYEVNPKDSVVTFKITSDKIFRIENLNGKKYVYGLTAGTSQLSLSMDYAGKNISALIEVVVKDASKNDNSGEVVQPPAEEELPSEEPVEEDPSNPPANEEPSGEEEPPADGGEGDENQENSGDGNLTDPETPGGSEDVGEKDDYKVQIQDFFGCSLNDAGDTIVVAKQNNFLSIDLGGLSAVVEAYVTVGTQTTQLQAIESLTFNLPTNASDYTLIIKIIETPDGVENGVVHTNTFSVVVQI